VRFSNEMDMIHLVGGQVWQARRGDLPNWFVECRDNNINPTDVHPSEWAWILPDTQFNHIIYNDSTLEELLVKVKEIIKY